MTEVVAICGPIVIRGVDGVRTTASDLDFVGALLDGPLGGAKATGVLMVAFHGSPLPSSEVRKQGDLGDAQVDERGHELEVFGSEASLGAGDDQMSISSASAARSMMKR